MNTIERLTAHLEEQQRADIIGGGVEAVMERGRRHQRNRVAAMAAGAVALIAVMVIGASALQSVVDQPDGADDVDAVDATPATAVGDLEWIAVESDIAYSTDLVAGADAMYFLTTAPGVRRDAPPEQQAQAVFASADGETWTHNVLARDLWIQDLAEHEGALYAIGTAPGVTPEEGIAMDVDVGVSEDGGASWSYVDLPLTATPPEGAPRSITSTTTSIAAGDTIAAVANTRFFADYTPLVPAEFRGGSFEVRAAEDGVEVVDWEKTEEAARTCGGVEIEGGGAAATTVVDDGCEEIGRGDGLVVWEATWEELGISGGSPFFSELFVSDDGESFEAVDAPFAGDVTVRLFEVEDGCVAGTLYGDIRLWHSDDGRDWVEMVGVPPMTELHAAGAVGGEIVVVGGLSGRPVVVSATGPGGPWRTHDPSAVIEDLGMAQERWVQAADVGTAGVALSLSAVAPGPAEPALRRHPLLRSVHVVGDAQQRADRAGERLLREGAGHRGWGHRPSRPVGCQRQREPAPAGDRELVAPLITRRCRAPVV